MKPAKITINNRNFGDFSILCDKEDEKFVKSLNLNVCFTPTSTDSPMVRATNYYGNSDHAQVSRLILEQHNQLDTTKNVYYKDMNHLNLQKKNLIIGRRPKN